MSDEECGDPYSGIGCANPDCTHRPEDWPPKPLSGPRSAEQVSEGVPVTPTHGDNAAEGRTGR